MGAQSLRPFSEALILTLTIYIRKKLLPKLPPKLPPRKILIQQVMQIRKKMRRKIRKRIRNRISRKGSLVRAIATITTIRAIREILSNI
jgi:hypothetical protein